MTAVTTASAAWTETAAIATVAVPCYLIWLIHFVRTQARIPSERTRQSSGAHSSPRVSANSSRRGEPYEQSGPALTLQMVGDEFDAIEFFWPGQKGSYTIHAYGQSVTRSYDWKAVR